MELTDVAGGIYMTLAFVLLAVAWQSRRDGALATLFVALALYVARISIRFFEVQGLASIAGDMRVVIANGVMLCIAALIVLADRRAS